MNSTHRIVLFSEISKRYVDFTYPKGYGARIADKLVKAAPIGDCSETHDTFVITDEDVYASVVAVFFQMHKQAISSLSALL